MRPSGAEVTKNQRALSVPLTTNEIARIPKKVIVSEIKILFAVSALFQIIEGTRISLFGALRALRDTNFTLLVSIISFFLKVLIRKMCSGF